MSDNLFRQYDFEHPDILFILEDKLKALLGGPLFYSPYFKTLELEGNESVLDFGCGGGTGSRCLAKLLNRGGHLTCIDTSGYWIAKAQKRLARFSNAECRLGDIRELDIPNSSFDVISTIHVVHDIAPADRSDIVETLSRKLRAGGLFFIREFTKKSHGMPVDDIRSLLSGADLNEIRHKETRSEYRGKYRRADQHATYHPVGAYPYGAGQKHISPLSQRFCPVFQSSGEAPANPETQIPLKQISKSQERGMPFGLSHSSL